MNIKTIIVTYNGMQWIDRCLSSLINSTVKSHIIVIDNLSTDGTASYINEYFPSVELIESKENLGFGKGNNIGLKKALNDKADYVFLLNQDAWVEPDTIEKLVTVQKNNRNYGILSPVHMNWEGTELEYYFSSIVNPNQCPSFINDIYTNKIRTLYDIEFINAAAWLISKETLVKIGGFDPLFNHYCEDLDYINRVKYKNILIGIVPSAIVMHKGTNKALTDFSTDLYFNYYFSLVDFLNPKNKLFIFYLIFTKTTIDKITSAFLYRKWAVLTTQFKLHKKITLNLLEIKKNRRISKNESSHIKS